MVCNMMWKDDGLKTVNSAKKQKNQWPYKGVGLLLDIISNNLQHDKKSSCFKLDFNIKNDPSMGQKVLVLD